MKKDALLASDMDGTVIPLDDKEERAEEIQHFNTLIEQHSGVALAYVTGRHLELGLAGVEQYSLPLPHIFVCDVGTTIYLRENGRWNQDQEYKKDLSRAWGGRTGKDIAVFLAEDSILTAQEEEKQKEFKQSYYVSLSIDHKTIVSTIENLLAEKGVKANVIYSVDTKKHVGLVDVLPSVAAKDYALSYLWKRLELDMERIVYAGDSGNDLLAFVSGFNAIVVNNTAAAVKKEVRCQARDKGIEHRIFFADQKYVKGVIEGCYHFKLFTE